MLSTQHSFHLEMLLPFPFGKSNIPLIEGTARVVESLGSLLLTSTGKGGDSYALPNCEKMFTALQRFISLCCQGLGEGSEGRTYFLSHELLLEGREAILYAILEPGDISSVLRLKDVVRCFRFC